MPGTDVNVTGRGAGLENVQLGLAKAKYSVIVNYNTSSLDPDRAMKKRFAQFLNEIVSISIMLLMAVALIAGQMNAGDLVRETSAGKSAVIVAIDAE